MDHRSLYPLGSKEKTLGGNENDATKVTEEKAMGADKTEEKEV